MGTLKEDLQKQRKCIIKVLNSSNYKLDGTIESLKEIDKFLDEEASIIYKYKVKWCPVCNQGWVEIFKNNETGEPLLCCNECYTLWNNPTQIERNNASGLVLDILTVEPTDMDIEKWGWEKYILKK